MRDAVLQVVYTYTTRRWLMWGMLFGSLFLALFLFGASQMSATPPPMLVGQLIALPIMLGMLALAIHAKWQFIHWRSRLYPGYAAPHLAILVVVIGLLLLVYPLVASPLLRVPPLGLVGFALLFGATVVWQMQTFRAVNSFLMLGLFISFYIPWAAKLWVDESLVYVPFRIAAVVVGALGLATWLARLTRMTEEDEDYFLPVQPNGANASRVEKSESRRTVARTLSRNHLASRITDAWHDRLAHLPRHSERTRWQLLRIGTLAIPAPMLAFNMVVMACMIVGMQYLMLNSGDMGSTSTNRTAMILAQLAGFSILVLPITCQFLSVRRPRFAQDLMLPMSRESFVDGLFRSIIEMSLWSVLPMLVVVVMATAFVAPQYFTGPYLIAGLVTIAACVPLAAGISFRMVLVPSGMARIAVLIALMYPLVGVALGLFAVTAYVNVGLGIVLGGVVAAAGYGACRWARKKWLDAELGCL